MAALSNSFEGGTPGATISTGNSGGASGDAFGSVVVDSALTYTSTAAHGSVAALASGASDAYVAWTSGLTGSSATAYARVYLRFNTLPGSNTNILRMLSGSNGIMGTIRINSAGTLGMLYGTGSLGGNTSLAVTTGAWFRVEIRVTAGAGATGTMIARIYWTPDATTPDQTITSANVATGSVNPTRLRCGILSSSCEVYFDDLAFSDVDWIGPASGGDPEPVTGGLSAALPAMTVDATATASVTAALDTHAPAGALDLNAGARVAADTAHTLPAALLGAAADLRITAALEVGFPAAGAGSDADLAADAALDIALPAAEQAVTAQARVGAVLNATIPALRLDLQSGEAEPATGALAAQMPAQALALAGQAKVSATLGVTLPAPGTAAQGTARIAAAAALDMAAPDSAFTGHGRIAAILGTDLAAADASLTGRARITAEQGASLPAAVLYLTDTEPQVVELPELTGTLSVRTDLAGTLASTGTLAGALSSTGRLIGTLI